MNRTIKLSLVALVALFVGCGNLSPVNRPTTTTTTETGDVTASGGSRVTSITFQSAGWAVMPLTLLGWIVATVKAKRRETAADTLIEAIETSVPRDESKAVKRAVAKNGNVWIDKRVACLSKKHGW